MRNSKFMKDKWKKAKEAGFKNLTQLKLARKDKEFFKDQDKCNDCIERPKFEVKQLDFNEAIKLCNRHFYLLAKKHERWFLEDLISL